MLNRFSPALDFYPLEAAGGAAPVAPAVVARHPAPAADFRLVRLGLKALAAVSTELAFRAAWRLFRTPRRLPVKSWEAAALADARLSHVTFEGRGVATWTWEPAVTAPATPPTALLLHGWEHRAAWWGVFARALTAAGWRVVAVDCPAHGASPGRRTTLVGYGQAAQAVVDAQPTGVQAVVAHSFGAAALSGLPVRFARPPRVALLSAPGSLGAVSQRFADLLGLPTVVVQRMADHIRRRFGRAPEEFSLLTMGPQLSVAAALLMHDEHDTVVPFAEAQAVAQAWPALTFEPTRGLGHNRLLRDPAVVARVVEFVTADGRRPA